MEASGGGVCFLFIFFVFISTVVQGGCVPLRGLRRISLVEGLLYRVYKGLWGFRAWASFSVTPQGSVSL